MWIDSHCHLDASEFAGKSLELADEAVKMGISAIVIPAVHQSNFARVRELAEQHEACFFTLGIHPMYVPTSAEEDLRSLREMVAQLMQDASSSVSRRFLGIGEIGLDFFVPALCESPLREKQIFFYSEQLKIARDFNLPVLLHVRRSQDQILKYLRRIPVVGGIAHAFNGSEQQAQHFIQLGFKLGFGGAMTFTRALQLRRLASNLPFESIVLETDAPDIAPRWCHPGVNVPGELVQIGHELATLRGCSIAQVAQQTSMNVLDVLPRLRPWLAHA
ncbi:TatD family hydrolase [Undibacterium cyanobacteriorum]|uniref:TatD family hydrolase n=1 Tax=Undibacterium cyanobacteriorum TaxID=3073561 RepID=A0ABY9REI0_9BURK|nr:TatD family hydrolase [Undibacterium sp. 20NA77.5]WMW79273.1 TatD family hydrolase [Undibacterium sp. 20NA77.5]